MKRTEKEQIVAEVAETVGRARGLFFTDFSGLTVEQATELRREFRKAGIDYRVVKNTLIQKALESASGYDKVFSSLVGPTGVAFAYDDPVAPAKIIQKFAEKHKKLSLKTCVIEKQVYEGSKLAELAKLPTRAELMAFVVGSIQSPLAAVPTVLNAVLRDLASVVDEIGKKKAA
ncbi:MAG: ribosomal protein [Bacteroidetes bacterium]|jgi:large subunit ribosomal protein L10|nr:ribosomal protein [Bacteroidota bacterium]